MARATPKRLRRRYSNREYPLVALRFEDGHEIRIPRGEGKTFDAYAGESIRILALWDATSGERELIATWKAEQFEQA